MTTTINVLWIDDEHNHDEFIPFIIQAENKGIFLEGFASYEDGFKSLQSNIDYYDVILLDALFFETNTSETVKSTGLGAALVKISELKSRKHFPHFILSGQLSFTKESNHLLEAHKLSCYDKKNPDDVKELLHDIIIEAQRQPITQIKQKYHDVLSICTKEYIGLSHFDRVLQLAKEIEDMAIIKLEQDSLNPIRKTIEGIFEKFNKIGLLPDEVHQGFGNINKSSLFLSGKHEDYSSNAPLIAPSAAEGLYRLLILSQDASHSSGNNLRADEYLSKSPNKYLYVSTIFLLFDLLSYFKLYFDTHQDKIANQSLWKLKTTSKTSNSIENKSADWVFGSISKVAENGYGTFLAHDESFNTGIPPYLMEKHSLTKGNTLQVKVKLNHSDKYFIRDIRKL